MDMRLRIIIIVFVVVVVFYFFQLIFGYMNKKEHFTSHYFDDVERYENAPTVTQESERSENTKPYELRIFLLDEIDKLNISDKTIKGNVMETLFSESSMNELIKMTKEDRIKKVKEVYDKAQDTSSTPIVKPPEKFVEEKSFDEKLKAHFASGTIHLPEVKDYFENDFKNKSEKAISKLDVAITALTDMKDILRGNTKEPYIPDIPVVPPTPPKPTSKELIEGFENVRGFAYY